MMRAVRQWSTEKRSAAKDWRCQPKKVENAVALTNHRLKDQSSAITAPVSVTTCSHVSTMVCTLRSIVLSLATSARMKHGRCR